MKTCSKCKEEKNIELFSKHKTCAGGVRSICKECVKLDGQKYKNENPEKVLESKRGWRLRNREQAISATAAWADKNPERAAAAVKRWQQANLERVKEKARAWASENRESRNATQRNRNAKKRNSEGQHSAKDVESIILLQRQMCACCQSKLIFSGVNRYHVDHIMPIALGGSNGRENLQALCKKCNLRKSAKPPEVWAKENGKLI